MDVDSKLFIKALKEGVVPATGCTEPIAVAFAAATCMEYLTTKPIENVTVKVSPNIMKNAMAVIVPGTGKAGLSIATAAGIIAGDASKKLGVLSNLKEAEVPKIKNLADSGMIKVTTLDIDDDLYVEVSIESLTDCVTVYIAGDHTNIFKITKNNEILKACQRPKPHNLSKTNEQLKKYSFYDIWNFSLTEPIENLLFIEEAATLNMNLAEEGLNNNYGLGVGLSLKNSNSVHFGEGINSDISIKMVAYSTAASDARMGGAELPAMSNSGSGNQGITATIPVCVAANQIKASREQIIRALTLSHLSAIYIHSFLPILSAFCATASAAMGSAIAICYLMDSDYNTGCDAIKNMVGDVPGMICDGAGCSCAMKVGTSVSSMYRSVNLALQGIVIPSSNGIVSDDIDKTIEGIGKLVNFGMKETDKIILSIMQNQAQNDER